MCLALPALVIERQPGDQLLIDLGGVRKSISGALTPDAGPGDYVIVHVGHAIGQIDPEEARRRADAGRGWAARHCTEEALRDRILGLLPRGDRA